MSREGSILQLFCRGHCRSLSESIIHDLRPSRTPHTIQLGHITTNEPFHMSELCRSEYREVTVYLFQSSASTGQRAQDSIEMKTNLCIALSRPPDLVI